MTLVCCVRVKREEDWSDAFLGTSQEEGMNQERKEGEQQAKQHKIKTKTKDNAI